MATAKMLVQWLGTGGPDLKLADGESIFYETGEHQRTTTNEGTSQVVAVKAGGWEALTPGPPRTSGLQLIRLTTSAALLMEIHRRANADDNRCGIIGRIEP